VSAIVKDTIENLIGGNTYCNTKVGQWTSAVVEGCLTGLTALQKPFKYIGELTKYKLWIKTEIFLFVNLFILTKSHFFMNSELHNNAENGCWTSYSQFMFLGQCD